MGNMECVRASLFLSHFEYIFSKFRAKRMNTHTQISKYPWILRMAGYIQYTYIGEPFVIVFVGFGFHFHVFFFLFFFSPVFRVFSSRIRNWYRKALIKCTTVAVCMLLQPRLSTINIVAQCKYYLENVCAIYVGTIYNDHAYIWLYFGHAITSWTFLLFAIRLYKYFDVFCCSDFISNSQFCSVFSFSFFRFFIFILF